MNDKKRNAIRIGDIAIIIIAVLMVLVIFLLDYNRENGSFIYITAGGSTKKYDLSENQIITLEKENGEQNIIFIKDKKAFMKSATCKNQICVKHKPIWKNGESIICIPNEVYVQVENGIYNEMDN